MPDPVRVPDPHPKRKPSASTAPYKVHCEQYMFDYNRSNGIPISPAYLDHLKDWKIRESPMRNSPSHSSGFSDGSCGSSPARSPNLGFKHPVDDGSDKPLSLVIRKNLTNFEDINANIPEYTVHRTNDYRYPFAPSGPHEDKKVLIPHDHDEAENDSGNEDLDRPLVISEEDPEPVCAEDQDIPQDFSLKLRHDNEIGKATTGLKIKDFAKFSSQASPTTVRTTSSDETLPPLETEDDVSSDCLSLSSGDTWSTSMVEGRPYSGSGVVVRRISRSSTGETVYQCDFCEKVFSNKSHFQSHLVTHTGERAFTCKTCEKTFGRKSTLRAHMTTHTKVSNFMCTMCEKACNDNNSLEEHMRMHTGEKPFVCSICQKAYARKSHLNVHYRVHTGERPFVCHHCDKDFTEKRFLNDHLQTAHNGADGPLKCPNCSREFAYKTSLKQHLKKQMCERNINRGGGTSVAGNVAKQFQCPFCEKSYSWKQTLKQHVSMYHRNKVHTDEFWRYELTKNRRTIMDDKVNEDLWKQQLGKHAEEAAKIKLENNNAMAQDDQVQWLEQVNQPSSDMTPEMKLIALQSLQKSLQYMSMAGNKISAENRLSAEQPAPENIQLLQNGDAISQNGGPFPQPIKQEVDAGQESYLSLLARIARRESNESNNNTDQGKPPVLPTNEESAANRTQLWLQQVTKYRSKVCKEEQELNHDQLWEQQIARIKTNPVKSPLETEEITLDDEHDKENSSQVILQVPKQIGIIGQVCNILNNNNNETLTVYRAQYISEHAQQPSDVHVQQQTNVHIQQQSVYQDSNPDKVFEQPAPVSLVTREQRLSQPKPKPESPPHEDQSMLKSLLLDRFKRKRSSSNDIEEPVKKAPTPPSHLLVPSQPASPTNPASPLHSSPPSHPAPPSNPAPPTNPELQGPKEILRKRLLGWVDPPQSPSSIRSRDSSASLSGSSASTAQGNSDPSAGVQGPSATIQSSFTSRPNESLSPPVDLNTSAIAVEGGHSQVSYTHTSVLKHLLHRYTADSK